jgi:RND superfamily putative drug exporter
MEPLSTTREPVPAESPRAGWRRAVAAVAGRRSKWVVLAVWVLLIAVGGSLASKIGSVENNEAQTWLPATAESTRALKVAESHFAAKNRIEAVVVYARPSGLTAADRAKVTADRRALGPLSGTPVPPVSYADDGRAALLTLQVRDSPSDLGVLGDNVDRVRDTARRGAPAGLQIGVAGPAGNVADYIHVFTGLNTTLLLASIGVVALVLLLTYRSPALWLVPLLTVAVASQVASAVVYLLGRHAGLLVNGGSASILTVLVLGVGTDYALLLVARYREELRRHADRHEAMALALRRCLPAIAASAGTVVIATLCLVAGSMNSTRALGPVAALGVAVAFLAMTTLLPALLVILGRWVFWPFVPRHDPDAPDAVARRGLWSSIAGFVGRRPRAVWIGTAVALAALALGSLTLHSGQTQADQFTTRTDSVVGQELLARHYPPGSSSPADIYTRSGDPAAVRAAAEGVRGVSSARVAASAGGWTHVTAVLAAPPDTRAARDTVSDLRAAVHRLPGPRALVGGQSAVALDTARAESREEWLLIPVILAVVLLMLVVLLRALVAPVVLLLSVVLSYGAAVGTAALLYHALGHPRIDRSLLLIGFLFLVALGVDYTIFLMSRVREETWRRGHRAGVLTGLAVTGGVITSAGLVLAASFGVLATLPVVGSLQQGLLIAVGVLLDTFLVRSLLVPGLGLHLGPALWWPARPPAPAGGAGDAAVTPAGRGTG